MKRRARGPLTALALLLAITFISRSMGREIWHWATHVHVNECFDGTNAGWFTVSRRTGDRDGAFRTWDVETGFLLTEGEESETDERITSWAADGRVDSQAWFEPGVAREKSEPPWWWGVTDQTQPSAPWVQMAGGFDAWAKRSLDGH